MVGYASGLLVLIDACDSWFATNALDPNRERGTRQ
jgi:hypothetical protein